jgi:hypothetical protein
MTSAFPRKLLVRQQGQAASIASSSPRIAFPSAALVRDTKHNGAGPTLHATPRRAWSRFTTSIGARS